MDCAILTQLQRPARAFGQRCPVRCALLAGLADRPPEEAQHRWAQDDEHPGIDDGVDGNEAQRDQVGLVALFILLCGVDVHTDLRRDEGENGISLSGNL